MQTTDNYSKHTASNPLQKLLIQNFFSTVVKEVKKLDPKSILDVGCGEGFTLQKLKDQGIQAQLEGVDFLHSAIEIGGRVHPDLNLKQGNIYDLPYKDNSFDLLICTEVLEHLEDPQKALKELKRVTKKYCLISVPNEPFFMLGNFLRGKNLSRFGNDIEHINHWSHTGIKNFVGKEFDLKSAHAPLPWTILVGSK